MKITIATLMILIAFASTTAFGAEKTKKKTTSYTPEQRQNMAATHEKMAVCLRSDKPMEDCKKEMMQSCQDMMGKDGCPMMMDMGKMHGKGKGMMQDQEKDKEKDKDKKDDSEKK